MLIIVIYDNIYVNIKSLSISVVFRNMNDLISVILPIYNVESYLRRCIESVIAQTYTNIEIFLVDDGSTDGSAEICDEYAALDNRINVIHKENGGLSDARNVGIRASQGRYITVIDSDDYVTHDYVAVLYNAIKRANCDIAIASHLVIYENGTVLDKSTGEDTILTPEQALNRILYDNGVDLSAWAKLYDRRLFDTIEYPVRRLFEDAATTYLLIDKADAVAFISKPIYYYMIRGNSITGQCFSSSKMDLITSTEEMCTYIANKYPSLIRPAKRRLLHAYFSTLSQLAMSSKPSPNEQKQLMRYIRKNGFTVLKDKHAPLRDKIAICAAYFGFGFFKLMWKFYLKASKRK